MLGRFRALPFALAIMLILAGSANALEVQTATVVVNHGNGITRIYDTSARNVAEFLQEHGIEIGEGSVSPPKATPVTPGMFITINTPITVYLLITSANGTDFIERNVPAGTTVQEMVTAYSLGTGSQFIFDYSIRNNRISPFMTISMDLVEQITLSTYHEISYETHTEYAEDLFEGIERIYQEGITGTRRVVENTIFQGTEVIFNTVESDEVLSEPVDRIVLIGTLPLPTPSPTPAPTPTPTPVPTATPTATPTTTPTASPTATPTNTPRPTIRANLTATDTSQLTRALNTNAQPTEYTENWRNFNGDSFTFTRRLSMTATAYHAGPRCTNKYPCHPAFGITASGLPARVGVVAVDPRIIPLRTKVYIVGYGFAITADTGSGVHGNIIDLFFNTRDECIQFGRRSVTVYVIEQFPDNATALAALNAINPYCRLEYFHGTCCNGIDRWGNTRTPNR